MDQYAFQIEGRAAEWIEADPVTISLLPDAEGTVQLRLHPPQSTPAGPVPFTVRIVSRADLEASVTIPGTAQVAPAGGLSVALTPQTSRARLMARHTLTVTNGSNVSANAALSASDPDEKLAFTLTPSTVSATPGTEATASIGVRVGKPIFLGRETPHPFTVAVQPEGGEPLVAEGTMVQQPIAPKWVMAAVPIVVAVLAFLGVKLGGDGGSELPRVFDVKITPEQALFVCFDQGGCSQKFTFSAGNEPGITFQCSLGSPTAGPVQNCANPFVTSPLTAGQYELLAVAIDPGSSEQVGKGTIQFTVEIKFPPDFKCPPKCLEPIGCPPVCFEFKPERIQEVIGGHQQ